MRLLHLTSIVACFAIACSSSPSAPAECKEISSRCHIDDGGTAEQNECHENAHDLWNAEQCTLNKARCLNICPPKDGGH